MPQPKVLPHNDEIEQSVLGAILIDKESITYVSGALKPEDFYNDTHAAIYESMLALFEARKPIDILTLANDLKKRKLYDKIGPAYVTELVNIVPTAANIEHYVQIIKEHATKRYLIRAGTNIVEWGHSEDEVPELLNKAEAAIFSISQGHTTRGFIAIKETLVENFDKLDEMLKNESELRGLPTGFADLDRTLSGLQDSNLIILAARPGQGKTAFIINVAQYVAVNEKIPVGIFSLEMSKEELVDRLLVGQSDIDAWKLKTRRLNESDYAKITEAFGVLGEAPIYIDDTPGITIAEIRSRARRLHLEKKVRLFIVDYLQLVDPGRRFESRVQEVAMVSQALKNLARELKVPVLALSQLSRAVEHRGEKKPQLADLRESGSIEQDADVVMFLYRPDDDFAPVIQTKLLIAKHRNGATGEIDLLFRGDRIKFYSMEKKIQAE